MIGDEGPEISFDLEMEFYLKGREDPIHAMMEISVPAMYIREIGVANLMEHCLDDFMVEVNQKSSSFVIMRAARGMRQVFWEDSIQSVTLLAPDMGEIEKLIEEAVNND